MLLRRNRRTLHSRARKWLAGISTDRFVSFNSVWYLIEDEWTGAGWGGATVHLVPESATTSFIKAIKAGYFAKRYPDLTEAELDDVCFATKPERGACLFMNTK